MSVLFSTCTQATASLCAFASKQYVTYYGLDAIRSELESFIGKVASNHFGTIAGSFIGSQASMLCSIPMTCLLADLASSAVRETISATAKVGHTLLFAEKSTVTKAKSLILDIGIKIARFAAYFFTKSYFCIYAMPFVAKGVEFFLRHVITLSVAFLPVPFTSALAVVAIASIITAPLTFLIGDLIGTAAGELTYQLLQFSTGP